MVSYVNNSIIFALAQEPEQQSEEETDSLIEQLEVRAQVHAEEPEVVPVVDTNIDEVVEDMELSSDIVSALGEVIGTQKDYGDDIHPNILKIIETILTEGLTKEQRETLHKSALIPANAKLLDAPRLNTEIIGLINFSTRTRDTLMVARQQDLGLAIGTICQALHDMTKKDFDKIKIIKMLGESARLLSNLHCQYTNIRKKLISPFLDKALQLNLKDNKRTEYLYSKLEETVKTTTAMKRAVNVLKPKNTTGTTNMSTPKNYQQFRRPNPPPANRGNNAHRGRSQQQTHNRRYQPHQPQKYPKRQQSTFSQPRAKYP